MRAHRRTNFYLHAGGGLSASRPTSPKASTTYDYDPRDPVPTLGGNMSFAPGLMQQGAWDQRGGPPFFNWPDPIPISARRDVLVYQTAPLEADVEVTGEITVTLWISSSAIDTNFTAKLIDAYPPSQDWPQGFAMNLTDGIARARYRNGYERAEPLRPGEAHQIAIELQATGNLFKAGHRIRLVVSSSNFPRFDVNLNTGEPPGRNQRSQVAQNAVFVDAARASHLVLPVVPGP